MSGTIGNALGAAQEAHTATTNTLGNYFADERRQLEQEPEYTFEELPEIIGTWLRVEERLAQEMADLDELIKQYEDEQTKAIQLTQAWADAKAAGTLSNEKERERYLRMALNNDEAFNALKTRKGELRSAKAAAAANYKRYSRRFEVLENRAERELQKQKVETLSEVASLLLMMAK
jgi:hypothetical protein